MDWNALEQWLLPLGILIAAAVLGALARAILLRRLTRISQRTQTEVDDLVVAAIRPHFALWFVFGGIVLAARFSPLEGKHVVLVGRIAAALLVLSISLAAAALIGALVESTARRTRGTFVSTSLTRNVLRLAVLLVGALLVLDNLDVKITPLLTALGVGSLAVALALQPTLSNLFAGIHITFSRPVRVGDFVELEGGTQGFVVDVGWRATQVRELSNDLVVVPNARLVEMIVKNYALPEPEQAVVVDVGVSHANDLALVERVTCEVGREVQAEIPGGVRGFEPFIRLNKLGTTTIDFSVILRAGHFTDRFLMTHEFLKRLKVRYDREGIEIPVPLTPRRSLDLEGRLARDGDRGRRPVERAEERRV